MLLLLAAIAWFERRLALSNKALAEAAAKGEAALASRAEVAEKKAGESSDKLERLTEELSTTQVTNAAAQAEIRLLTREGDQLRAENERLRTECGSLRHSQTDLRLEVEKLRRQLAEVTR